MKTLKFIQTKSLMILVIGLLFLNSCNLKCLKGNGDITSEAREISNFSELEVSSALKVIYTPSSTYKVEVVADDNLIGYITTEVHGNELQIDIKNRKCFNKISNAEIHVSAPTLNKIDVSGASEFESATTFNTANVELKASGASKININCTTTSLNADISGASNVVMNGSSTTIDLSASGASKIDAGNLLAKSGIIDFSGASTGVVNIKNSLSANLSGASDLDYYGNPTVNSNLSGSSTITKK